MSAEQKPTEWAHLPNAKHIDNVIAFTRANPDAAWEAARDAARDAAWEAAWEAAWGATRDAAREAARGAAWEAARGAALGATRGAAWEAARYVARGAARDAAWGATLALVAYDHTGAYFDMPFEAVEVLAAHGEPGATLMLPMLKVMKCYQPADKMSAQPEGEKA